MPKQYFKIHSTLLISNTAKRYWKKIQEANKSKYSSHIGKKQKAKAAAI